MKLIMNGIRKKQKKIEKKQRKMNRKSKLIKKDLKICKKCGIRLLSPREQRLFRQEL
jgi:hypothetical protein